MIWNSFQREMAIETRQNVLFDQNSSPKLVFQAGPLLSYSLECCDAQVMCCWSVQLMSIGLISSALSPEFCILTFCHELAFYLSIWFADLFIVHIMDVASIVADSLFDARLGFVLISAVAFFTVRFLLQKFSLAPISQLHSLQELYYWYNVQGSLIHSIISGTWCLLWYVISHGNVILFVQAKVKLG